MEPFLRLGRRFVLQVETKLDLFTSFFSGERGKQHAVGKSFCHCAALRREIADSFRSTHAVSDFPGAAALYSQPFIGGDSFDLRTPRPGNDTGHDWLIQNR